MAEILLVAQAWKLRAMVRAQLLEEGFEVRAWPSLDLALAHLARGGGQPQATILDLQGLDPEASAILDLWQLTGRAPLILCGGLLSQSLLSQEGLPPVTVLLRPFRVADVIAEVRRHLACPEGAPGAGEGSS